jgi:hypothetical protein
LFGRPPLTIDAVLAAIVDSGRAICKIRQAAVELNQFCRYFINSYETLPQCSWLTPSKEVTCVGLGGSIESTPPEGQTAHHGDDVCGIVVLVVDSAFHTIPSVHVVWHSLQAKETESHQ